MRIFFGIVTGLLTLFLFYNALLNTLPGNSYHAVGFNIGTHLSWILFGIITFFILRKKRSIDTNEVNYDNEQNQLRTNQLNNNHETKVGKSFKKNKKSIFAKFYSNFINFYSNIDEIVDNAFGMGSKSNDTDLEKNQSRKENSEGPWNKK